MSILINKSWWRDFYKTSKCMILRLEIWLLLYEESDEIAIDKIDSLVKREQYRYPGKQEDWYLQKIIYDLRSKVPI